MGFRQRINNPIPAANSGTGEQNTLSVLFMSAESDRFIALLGPKIPIESHGVGALLDQK